MAILGHTYPCVLGSNGWDSGGGWGGDGGNGGGTDPGTDPGAAIGGWRHLKAGEIHLHDGAAWLPFLAGAHGKLSVQEEEITWKPLFAGRVGRIGNLGKAVIWPLFNAGSLRVFADFDAGYVKWPAFRAAETCRMLGVASERVEACDLWREIDIVKDPFP